AVSDGALVERTLDAHVGLSLRGLLQSVGHARSEEPYDARNTGTVDKRQEAKREHGGELCDGLSTSAWTAVWPHCSAWPLTPSVAKLQRSAEFARPILFGFNGLWRNGLGLGTLAFPSVSETNSPVLSKG